MTIRPASIAAQFERDVADLMPGCTLAVTVCDDGLVVKATHRTTGLAMTIALATDDDWHVWYRGAHTSGRSAYGFDSAVTHGYRHCLDFTADHGPGTAWDYHLHATKEHA